MSDHKNVLLGLLIIGGAYMYTRSRSVVGATGPGYTVTAGNPNKALGIGSMPGSAGTGVSQVIGGLIGNIFAPHTGGGTSTGAPVPFTSNDVGADYILQNNVPAADPNQTFDPTGGSFGPIMTDLSSAYA